MISGGLATLGNLAAVWAARPFMSFGAALLCGIAVGMTLSFVLSKFFAFRSRNWSRAGGEAGRFLIVYGVGLVIYYFAALAARAKLVAMEVAPALADIAGVLVGAALLVVTGYFGHRFFTYRTGREPAMSRQESVDWDALARQPDPCIVCGATDARQLYQPTFRGSLTDAHDYFLAHRKATAHGPIAECRRCGFIFTSPRLAPADYDNIYGNIATPHEGVTEFDAAKVARFRRLASIVRANVRVGAVLLDFGCGDGAFLRELNDPAAKGFEIGAGGRHKTGPSEIILGDWATVAGSADLPRGAFDAITAFDVLEHLPRIGEDVSLIRALLKPGGLFFASVPNIRSLAARVMGKRWNMILLEHLWYFSPRTFDAFLAGHGFERVAMRSLPFDAPLAHVATRLGQTFGMTGTIVPRGVARALLPVPAGIMLGTYRAV